MSKTLYFTVEFVALHQKDPGFSSGGYLDINGVATFHNKYEREFGFGDPGENPGFDSGDFTEWSIGFSTFVKPATYDTATGTYQNESSGPVITNNPYKLWHVMAVPDTFILPARFLSPSSMDYINAALDQERGLMIKYFKMSDPGNIKGLSIAADHLNTSYDIYKTLKTHLEAQFQIINAGLSGTIDVNTMMTLSDNASTTMQLDLTLGKDYSLLSAAARQIVADRLVAQDTAHGAVSVGLNAAGAALIPPGAIVNSHQVVGSPTSDALVESGHNGDVVLAGLGNDYVYAGAGSGILIGGGGIDTIDYGSMGSSLNINLETGLVQGAGFTDRIGGFEYAAGGSDNDTFRGTNDVANYFSGHAGNDTFFGLSGNDWFEAGPGQDTLDGGLGADTAMYSYGIFDPNTFTYAGLRVSLANSLLNTGEAAGDIYWSIENISGSDAGDNLSGDVYSNVLRGNGGNDALYGDGGGDILYGGIGNDTLNGGDGGDALYGDAGNDTLTGGAGNDFLFGGAGIDRLTGGLNNDYFVMNTPLSTSTNRDIIVDFNPVNDTFQLENAIFTRLGALAGAHALAPAFFRAGAAALDANDYLVYNRATGNLMYDVNGVGAGGTIIVATLLNKPVLTASDFVVI